MKKQIDRCQKPISKELRALSLHPVLKQVYANRDIQLAADLDCSLHSLLPYHALKDIDRAVDVLVMALQKKYRILVLGDYDVDGATSTVLAVRLLRLMGASHVDFLVPNRFADGYGLTSALLEQAMTYQPNLILTVDNGISSVEGIRLAKERGVEVVVTDHHLASDELPDASAIVNPNQPQDQFASKNLAGVGVVFYLMLALRARLREIGWFQQLELPDLNLGRFLDLVALGTIADVVSLDHNNRILVYQGLQRIRAGSCVAGISALLKVAGRSQLTLKASDISYAIAPRLNAAGRLESMMLAVSCLLTDDPEEALSIAKRLDQLNIDRREIEKNMHQEALHFIAHQLTLADKALPHGLCLLNKAWHEGVIGILAARIKDHIQRPVIVFTEQDRDQEWLQGSARSIEGLHIRDLLDRISIQYPHLMKRYGGHAMAAGITIHRQDFTQFSAVFNEQAKPFFDDLSRQTMALMSDGELPYTDISIEFARLLRDAQPWGQDFSEPLFEGRFKLIRQFMIAEKHLKLVFLINGQAVDAMAFNVDAKVWPNYRCDYVHLLYRLDLNEFKNKTQLKLMVEYIEPSL